MPIQNGPLVIPTDAVSGRVRGLYDYGASAILPTTDNPYHYGLDLEVSIPDRGAATLGGGGSLLASGYSVKQGRAELGGGGSIQATGRVVHSPALNLIGTAKISYEPVGKPYEPPQYNFFLPTPREGFRVIAQEILTGEWIDWDFPLKDVQYELRNCGPSIVSGVLEPEIHRLTRMRLESGSIWLHLEQDEEIITSAILSPASLEGETLQVDAEGFTAYAAEIPYRDAWTLRGDTGKVGVKIDPMDVVRECWAHIQSYADGDLGVIVAEAESPVRIGEEKKDVEFETGSGEAVAFTAGPYTLDYWENPMIGDEIDKLAVDTPFEYRERNYWNADKTDVIHKLELAYPRIGIPRPYLTFEQGRAISDMLPFAAEEYASEVILKGRGEGKLAAEGVAARRIGNRIRKVKVVNDKTVASRAVAKSMAQDLLGQAAPLNEIKEIEILADHPDAPFGSFGIGDDIYVEGEVAYLGDVALWHRIISFKPDRVNGTIVLGLLRTERFIYGPQGRSALAVQAADGSWVYPGNYIEGPRTEYDGPMYRDANGNWVPAQ